MRQRRRVVRRRRKRTQRGGKFSLKDLAKGWRKFQKAKKELGKHARGSPGFMMMSLAASRKRR